MNLILPFSELIDFRREPFVLLVQLLFTLDVLLRVGGEPLVSRWPSLSGAPYLGTAALLCRRRCRGAVALAGSGASLAVHPRITIGDPAVLGIVGVTSPDGLAAAPGRLQKDLSLGGCKGHLLSRQRRDLSLLPQSE